MNRTLIPQAVAVLVVLGALVAAPPAWAEGAMEIVYTTPHETVAVKGRVLTFEDRHYSYPERSPAPNPSKVTLKRWQVSLPPSEVRKLAEQVHATPLSRMKEHYGSATRRYVYALRVRDGKRDRTVEYWSGPDETAAPPEEYRKLGAYLLDLARRATAGAEPEAAGR